nr:FeoB-associated Cys-rich membrane protein [uncultured Polaribacter sp.]
MQQVLVYILVFLAIFFLVKKFGPSSKKKSSCNSDCACH